jgi:hypothetical protein
MLKTTVALIAGCLLAGCGLSAEEAAAGTEAVSQDQALTATQVTVQTASTLGTKPKYQSTFNIAATYAVYLDVSASAGAGNHQVIIDIFDPHGNAWQSDTLTFTGLKKGASLVTDTVPVAGTWIQQYNLTGAWTAQVFLDGASAPSATVTFTLN